jgi:hypothetical protein
MGVENKEAYYQLYMDRFAKIKKYENQEDAEKEARRLASIAELVLKVYKHNDTRWMYPFDVVKFLVERGTVIDVKDIENVCYYHGMDWSNLHSNEYEHGMKYQYDSTRPANITVTRIDKSEWELK